MKYLLVIILIFLVPACRVKKDISNFSEFKQTIDLSDSTVKRYEAIDLEWFRLNESLIKRDGTLEIRFDSLTSVIVLPDHTIQAVGFNPVIYSSKSELNKLTVIDSLNISKNDSLVATGSKKKVDLGSTENSKTNIDKTPSLTPWIGVGLAVAVVALAVLWYLFR